MAEDKKSFILYVDQRYAVDLLPDDTAGKLFKHLFAYVNDEDPEVEDMVLKVAFEPIKQQLKRDLIKYNDKKAKYSGAGKASAEARAKIKREQEATTLKDVSEYSTKPTVNVNVSGNVNDNVINKKIPFNFIWNLYDKKVGDKSKLQKKWDELDLKTQEKIVEYVPDYKTSQPDKKYRKNFQTFLNQKGWLDEIIISEEFDNGMYKTYTYDQVIELNDKKFRGTAFQKFRPVKFDGEDLAKYVSIEDIKKHKLQINKPKQ